MTKMRMTIYSVLLLAALTIASSSSRRTHEIHSQNRVIGATKSNRQYPGRRQDEYRRTTNSMITMHRRDGEKGTISTAPLRNDLERGIASTAAIRHDRERGTAFTVPLRREGDWDITFTNIRTPLNRVMGLAPYSGKMSDSSLTHREWEGGPVKHCPSGCTCSFKQDPNLIVPMQMLVVLDCIVDPSPVLSKLFNSYPDIPSLMLDNCNISKLPLDILTLRNLAMIHVVKNKIPEIPIELQKLKRLQGLVIQYNKAEHMKLDNITKLSHLKVLDLVANRLAALPEGIRNMRKLVFLNVKGNRLKSLPAGLWTLKQLWGLVLSKNEQLTLPSEISNLTGLVRFYLASNNMTVIPAVLGRLPQLQYLDLSENRIQTLPAHIRKLSHLQYLYLRFNRIQIIPSAIAKLTQLQHLYLEYNKIQVLPAAIGKLSQLKHLDLRYNMIESLPTAIGNLTQLLHIYLDGNSLHTLPNETRHMSNMNALWAAQNLFKQVPPIPTEHLMSLDLSGNEIQTLPCKKFTDCHLVQLILNKNMLTSFDCWNSCQGLANLYLSYNAFERVPCEAFNVETLVVLSMTYNNISTLPEICTFFTGQVSRLREIYMSHNNISTLFLQPLCGKPKYEGSFIDMYFTKNIITTIETKDSNLTNCFSAGAVIDFSYNKLSTLDSWPLLVAEQKSITLNVGHNNLSNFINSAELFIPKFQSGTKIRMQWNHIKYFNDVFHGWGIVVNTTENLNTLMKNVYFDLAGNPLVCDCVDYEVYRYIQTLRPEEYTNLLCHKPPSLSSKNPCLISLDMFVCDLHPNCPTGCSCSQVPHFQIINVTCSNFNETDLPEILPKLIDEKYTYRLDLCHQNLTEITFRPYFQQCTEILLSNNSIFAIKVNSSTVFSHLKILHLDHNSLERLPDSVLGMTNSTARDIQLGSNPWACDCEIMAMNTWLMKNWHIIRDRDTIRCHSPTHMVGIKVQDIDRSLVCFNEDKTVVYVVGTIISSICLIFLVYITNTELVKYCKRRKIVIDECDGENKQFDIFMSASAEPPDDEYIERYLIPELEKHDFRVLYHREHFDPGKAITVNVSEAIAKSKRTLVFFSDNYRESGMCIHEFNEAYHLDVQNNTSRLITIKDTHLDVRQLGIDQRHYFRTHTYLPRDDVNFWRLLLSVLPKNKLGAQVRNEPS